MLEVTSTRVQNYKLNDMSNDWLFPND